MKTESAIEGFYADLEPHFAFRQSGSLCCPKYLPVDKSLGHLNYRILQDPTSLSDHVKKLKLIRESKIDSDLLVAALADLFHVLKQDGHSLRRRLLYSSRDLIDASVFNEFGERLATGDLCTSEKWLAGFPTLMIQEPVVVVVSSKGNSPRQDGADDLLELARGYIENSQLDLAIDTLEKAVTENPLESEIAELLTELYRRTSDRDRFVAMHQKLVAAVDSDLPGCWIEVENQMTQSVARDDKQP